MSAADSVAKSGTDRSVLTSPTADDDQDFAEPTSKVKQPSKERRRTQVVRKSLGSDFDSVAAHATADDSAHADAEMVDLMPSCTI
jgi:hypothetical protein